MVGSGARMGNNTKKLRSCMFGHKRIPSREGGIEVVVEELSTRMVKLGHQVTCYNRGGHHVSGKEFDGERLHEYKGVKLKTVPTINRKGLTAVSSSFFAALASAFGRYDVVHIHAEGWQIRCRTHSCGRPSSHVLDSKAIWKAGCCDNSRFGLAAGKMEERIWLQIHSLG